MPVYHFISFLFSPIFSSLDEMLKSLVIHQTHKITLSLILECWVYEKGWASGYNLSLWLVSCHPLCYLIGRYCQWKRIRGFEWRLKLLSALVTPYSFENINIGWFNWVFTLLATQSTRVDGHQILRLSILWTFSSHSESPD